MNLIKYQQTDIDKIHLYRTDPLESKYRLLINGREKVGIENLENLKALINYSQTIDDVSENLEDYKTIKKRNVLIVFDDLIAGIDLIKH